MKRTISTACLAIGLISLGTAAAHADPRSGDNQFTGFYVGGLIGYDNYHLDSSATLPTYGVSGDIDGLGGNGIAGGVIAGYNMALAPRIVAGVEGQFRYSDADMDASVTGLGSAEAKARESWGVGARLGYIPMRNVMLYASGGWTQGRFKAAAFDTSGTSVFSDHDTQDAWRVGGGIEAALGGNWTARVDYTYANYSNYDFALSSTDSISVKPTSHQVSLAVSRYF